MESFLTQVSADLYEKYGTEISTLCLVFPSRRANLFFAEALSKHITQPVWQPQALSISDLIFAWANRRPSDSLLLLAELYKVYQGVNAASKTQNPKPETNFDAFYHRGEMLLQDFDQVDKYLVPAKSLFQNLHDQKMLEGDYSFLTPEQVAAVQQFWSSFTPQKSHLQESFTQMWAQMYPLYSRFREVLTEKGLAYEGMLYREVAEQEALLTPDPKILCYIFIGFNALNNCERMIFKRLHTLGLARFYWDDDRYYVDDEQQEAGLFLRKNKKEFQSVTLSVPPSCLDNLSERHNTQFGGGSSHFSLPKEIESWAVPSNVLQTKLVPQIIKENHLYTDKRTAVVLCNESLLIPLLSALPTLDADINVTMGYPLSKTSFYNFLEAMLLLYRSVRRHGNSYSYYHVEVSRLLNHPFISSLCPKEAKDLRYKIVTENILFVSIDTFASDSWLFHLFCYPTKPDDWLALLTEILEAMEDTVVQTASDFSQQESTFDPLLLPAIRCAATEVKKFGNTIKACGLEIDIPLLFSLLQKKLHSVSIPFSGEPMQGIQVMGFLETRALDFEHVVLLSAQEGSLPSASEAPSFIPYNLRAGFGLPVQQEREAMYAYYFYRLLQRAKKVSLLFSEESDGVQTAEQSRYLLQLEAESPHTIVKKRLSLPVILPPPALTIEIEKRGIHKKRLLQYLDANAPNPLTPSAVNAYIQCPLRFCYQYIEHIREERSVEEDATGRGMGTLLHKVMESLYTPFLNEWVTTRMLERLTKDTGQIRRAVECAIQREYAPHNHPAQLFEQGRWLILADVITEYVTQVIQYDITQTPFCLKALEERTKRHFSLLPPPLSCTIPLGGVFDRIQERDGIFYVIDYKTGKEQRSFESLEALFAPERVRQNSAVFQILWYVMLYQDIVPQKRVVPALYYVRSLFAPEASTLLYDKSTKQEITDTASYVETFRALLGQKLAELFDLTQPFTQTPDKEHCTYCIYNSICRKNF